MKKMLVKLATGSKWECEGGIRREQIGPNGEFLLEYSIFDAINAGFNKIVFVVQKKIEKV